MQKNFHNKRCVYYSCVPGISHTHAHDLSLKTLSENLMLLVGRGGALVETMTFNRRVVGSTPALAAT